MPDKSAVFVDGGYLDKVLVLNGKPRLDYLKFSEAVSRDTERLRTYYYNCMPYQSSPPTEDEKRRFSRMDKFMHDLRMLPRFEVRLGRLRRIGSEYTQKRIDVLLAVDLVRMSWDKQIQVAVLITGDSDYVPAVQAAKEAGVLTRLYYCPGLPLHNELLEAFDERLEITKELIDSCLRGK